MKRSEFVKELKHVYVGCKSVNFSADQIVDSMLVACEKAGMLPPAYDVFKGRKDTFNDMMMSNQWEPEDET